MQWHTFNNFSLLQLHQYLMKWWNHISSSVFLKVNKKPRISVNYLEEIPEIYRKRNFERKRLIWYLKLILIPLLKSWYRFKGLYDVKALFTFIPTNLATECVDKLLTENTNLLAQLTSLNKNDMLRLLEICIHSTIFQWNNKIYQQCHGTPMGSPISVTLAGLTMQSIEQDCIIEKISLRYHCNHPRKFNKSSTHSPQQYQSAH